MEKRDLLLEEFENFKIDVKNVKGGAGVLQRISSWHCTGDDSTGHSDPDYDPDIDTLPPIA
jgi:hypothetical protein